MRKAPRRSLLAPPLVSRALAAFCVMLPLLTYLSPGGGRLALSLTLATFVLLVMEVLTVEKPFFSQLTAAVFGLYYCGEKGGKGLWIGGNSWENLYMLLNKVLLLQIVGDKKPRSG